jgi:transposase
MSQKQKPQNHQKAIYTTEYRTQAVQLALGAVSIAQAARDLGISEKTLHGWVAAQKNASSQGTTVEANKAAASELARLRRECARLRQERDFLLEAGAFFRREPK